MASDGGPAFPCTASDLNNPSPGMSLLDWFAGQALIGLLAGDAFEAIGESIEEADTGHTFSQGAAHAAYLYAAAMLAERERRMKGADDATA